MQLAEDVDLSYKKGAYRLYYDIESIPNLYTCTFWHQPQENDDVPRAVLWFYGGRRYDHVSDDDILSAFREYVGTNDSLGLIGLSESDRARCDVRLCRFHRDDPESIVRLRGEVRRMLTCKPMTELAGVEGSDDAFTEYVGWNSYNYDLPLMTLIASMCDAPLGAARFSLRPKDDDASTGVATDVGESRPVLSKRMSPSDIRLASDILIRTSEGIMGIGRDVETRVQAWWQVHSKPGQKWIVCPSDIVYRNFMWDALYADGHVDVAKMLRETDDNAEQRFPPGLKKYEAKIGMDIIADPLVGLDDDSYVIPDDMLLDFVKYNLHDVIATCHAGESPNPRGKLAVRDSIRVMNPYTSARAVDRPPEERGAYVVTPPERDISEANLTALSLIGPRRIRPRDYDAVSYEFPVPVPGESGKHVSVDLLERMHEVERYMPDDVYAFFSHYRGRDTRAWDDLFEANRTQPINHRNAVNVPYYREDGGRFVPVDAYIRLSTGGAHGSVFAGLHEMDPDAVSRWTRSDAKPRAIQIPTLDLHDVVHVDYTSYYPTLMRKMGAFMTSENVDRYTNIYDTRVHIKAQLKKFEDRSTWGPEQFSMNERQNSLKLLLNSATGKANTHHAYAKLPIDNKILSMRLIGNMSIWALAQRMTFAGGFVISTNTDGIYVANITMQGAQDVIDGFITDYDIPVDPEPMHRFVNRDVSNRMEFKHELYPDVVSGLLKSGGKIDTKAMKAREARERKEGTRPDEHERGIYLVAFNEVEDQKSPGYPLAVGNAVVRYVAEDPDWNRKPYDEGRMRSILEEIRSATTPMAWVKIQASNKKNRLLVGGRKTQKVDRVILTTDGEPLTQQSYRTLPREQAWPIVQASLSGVGWDEMGEVAAKAGVEVYGNVLEARPKRLVLARKTVARNRREQDRIDACETQPDASTTREGFDEMWRSQKATCVAYGEPGAMHELKGWRDSKLSGFGDEPRGVLLDSVQDLRDFDMGRLDMEQYLAWATRLMEGWKVPGELRPDGTIDLPEGSRLSLRGRVTKAQAAADAIAEAYATVLRERDDDDDESAS